jgi:hypothetical protein
MVMVSSRSMKAWPASGSSFIARTSCGTKTAFTAPPITIM